MWFTFLDLVARQNELEGVRMNYLYLHLCVLYNCKIMDEN